MLRAPAVTILNLALGQKPGVIAWLRDSFLGLCVAITNYRHQMDFKRKCLLQPNIDSAELAGGRRGVSGLALLTFTPRGAGKDSARSSLLGFKFHGFLLSRFDPNVPMGQRTPVPNGRGRGGMETLQRGHVRAWQLRAVCSPGGEQSGPREDRGWEVSSYRPGNLGLVTEHTQRPGCQEAEGFLRVSVKPRKVLLA